MNILEEADNLINGDRAADYGDVSENFERIARMWGAYRGQYFDRHDVAQMMILVKVARQATGYHRDSNVDIAGYAALDEQCHDEVRERNRINESYQRYLEQTDQAPQLNLDGLYDGLPDLCCEDQSESEWLGGLPESVASLYDAGVIEILTSPVLGSMLGAPVNPRVWDSIDDVPEDVDVTDNGGGLWSRIDGLWHFDAHTDEPTEAYYSLRDSERYGPFTEVVA